jgi:ribonuclease HI
MDSVDLPRRWLTSLNLKLFATNSRHNQLPNLWCLCKVNISPTILSSDSQCVSFSIVDNSKTIAIAAVYASTNYLTRRQLWDSLNLLQSQYALPWCFMGDFNVILGAHEHRGRILPARLPMKDFQVWTDTSDLIHLPTRGVEFTWANGRGGVRHTEKRLDRVVCNQAWMDLCTTTAVSTLTKHRSDHFPLLLDFALSNLAFASQFKFMRMWTLHPDCKNVIHDSWNITIFGSPMFVLSTKLKILKGKLKSWNKTIFGNVHDQVHSADMQLNHIQHQIQQLGHSDSLLQQEKLASIAYEDALCKEEAFWQEKARVNWHLHGDRNTKYFHRLAKIKTSTKFISSLQDGDNVLTNQDHIANHVVNYYQTLFSSNIVMQDPLLAEEVIPNLVTAETNDLLTVLPSPEEIKQAVFSLNKDSAPGPDGFGAIFYQHYWDIVKSDVVNAVLEFFTKSWILPGFNSNIIALIPKSAEATSIAHYRPIAMANFKFKVISKILADRLAAILPSIISEEQKGFIHDRNIKDCLCTASEAANLLHNKTFGGNLALQIDITKAFDTLNWNFLLKVLKFFGFNDIFINWIHVILKSAYLSVSINGRAHGYFNCTRGVRQGDPLSPLLFCIAEDVLSRSITKLVTDGVLNQIKGTRNVMVPSHSFYADDLMIFCKGTLNGLKALKNLFNTYALESGQIINTSKSIIFSGSITPGRLALIAQLLDFKIGSLPFLYLGVPIFKGKPKVPHLHPIADKVKLKLSAWKASLLSIAGRVQLVNSVIQSMLIYSMSLYSWPISLLKDIERSIRNFIWSGDSEKRKLVTVSWKKVCRPYAQGGLNIRSLISLNKATNLHLCWKLLTSQCSWAKLIRDRVCKNHTYIRHHISSSIWSSVKEEVGEIDSNTSWLIGNGEQINFWTDKWCGDSLAHQFNIPPQISRRLTSRVSDYIINGQWHIPDYLSQLFPDLNCIVQQESIPLEPSVDTLIWCNSDDGSLTLKQAYLSKVHSWQDLTWAKCIWSADIPPSKSLLVWRLMHEKMPTDDNLRLRGCYFPSICSLCHNQEESSFHLFFNCEFAIKLWSWLAGCLDTTLQFSTIDDIWDLCNANRSPQCKLTLTAAIIHLFNTIWYARNQARFQNNHVSWKSAIALIMSNTFLTGSNTHKPSSNSIMDFTLLKKFDIIMNPPKVPTVKEIHWHPPLLNWVKCNIDGASHGNPGPASCGGVFRNYQANFLYAFAKPLGFASSYHAELCGAMQAVDIAFCRNWKNLWLETDSTLVVLAFKSNPQLIPWALRNRWKNVLVKVSSLNFRVTHICREGNQVADLFANHGLSLNSLTCWSVPPLFSQDFLLKNKLGLPSFRVCLS